MFRNLNVIYQGTHKGMNYQIIEYDLPLFKKYLCGYVEVPAINKYYGDYSHQFEEIGCHGGITYTGGKRTDGTGHWIGFDTIHCFSNKKHRTINFCIKECKNIIDQLLEQEI